MVRIGISVYLMLATLVGPGLCCCTTPRLLAALAHPGKTEQPRLSCCPHHHQSGVADHPTGPEQAPQKREQPGHPDCPCQENRATLALLSPDSESALQLLSRHLASGWMTFVGALPMAVPQFVAGLTGVPGGCPAFPFLTARDMLRSLHVLRC